MVPSVLFFCVWSQMKSLRSFWVIKEGCRWSHFTGFIPLSNAAPGQYFGSTLITSWKICWPVVMLSAHILNFWPLASCLANLWPVCTHFRVVWMISLLSQNAHRSGSFLGLLWLPSTVPRRHDICLEINLPQPSSVYGFCDICIAAATLRGSEGYVNDFRSS